MDKISVSRAFCSRDAAVCAVGGGPAVVQGSRCFLGCQAEIPGEMEPEAGDAEWLCPGEQHRALHESCSQPGRFGAMAEKHFSLVQCSMPWHCLEGGRKGAAGSNLCCLKTKLFGLQCAARVFLGLVLQAGLVA